MTHTPNLPPPTLGNWPAPNAAPPTPANWAPPVPGNIAPAPANVAANPVEESELYKELESIFTPEYLLKDDGKHFKEIHEIASAFEDFEEANDQSAELPAFEARTQARKEELLDIFKTHAAATAPKLKSGIEAKAREIEDEKYGGLNKLNKEERVSRIRRILESTFDQKYAVEELPAALEQAGKIIDSQKLNIAEDPAFQTKAEEEKEHAKKVLMDGEDGNDNKPEPEPTVNSLLNLLRNLNGSNRQLGAVAFGRKGSFEETEKRITTILASLKNLIITSKDELLKPKADNLSKWLEEQGVTGFDEARIATDLNGFGAQFEAKVTHDFYDEANIRPLVGDVIMPTLEQNFGHLMQPEVVTPKPARKGPDVLTKARSQLLGMVTPDEVPDLNVHIGRFISAGGSLDQLNSTRAIAVKYAKDPATRLQFIKDALAIPE